MSQTEKDQKSELQEGVREDPLLGWRGWGAWKSRVSEEWSLAEGRRRRDRGKGSRLDEEEERVPLLLQPPDEEASARRWGAGVLLLRDPVPPRGRAAGRVGGGLTGRAGALLPPRVCRPRASPRGLRRPPAPAPAASSASAAPRGDHNMAAAPALPLLPLLLASAGAGPAGAGPRPALRSSSLPGNPEAAVSAVEWRRRPAPRGVERGRPAPTRGRRPGGGRRRRGRATLRVPAAPPLRSPGRLGQPGLGGGGGGSRPHLLPAFHFFLRGRRRGMV